MQSTERPDALAGYPVLVELPVQWGDQDAFGHVNNTVPIRWFETSRIAYIEQSGLASLMRAGGTGPILASVHCNYRRQIHYPDTVIIGGHVASIGKTSLVMTHAVYSRRHEAIAAEGESVIVLFDYATNRPIRMSEEIRGAVDLAKKQVDS